MKQDQQQMWKEEEANVYRIYNCKKPPYIITSSQLELSKFIQEKGSDTSSKPAWFPRMEK